MKTSNELTVADAVTLLATVVASDSDADLLVGILGTSLGGVAELIAVVALLHEARDGLTSIGKTRHVLLGRSRPSGLLTGTVRLGREAVLNSELLAQVALKVHVSVSRSKSTLGSDEVDAHLLATESLLKDDISHLREMLEVLLNGLLGLNTIALVSCFDDLVPGHISVDILDLTEVNLARVLAVDDEVTCRN